jgi:hypothetical protein
LALVKRRLGAFRQRQRISARLIKESNGWASPSRRSWTDSIIDGAEDKSKLAHDARKAW